MDLITEHWSLFLPPQAYNSGDLGKSLNDNFVLLDSLLWDIRTNYKDIINPEINTPTGGFWFNQLEEKLYIKIRTGLYELGSFAASGGVGISVSREAVLSVLTGAITQNELAYDLSTAITQIDLGLSDINQAKADAIQAKLDTELLKADTIQALNAAAGYATDSYNERQQAHTEAGYAQGYAQTASQKAEDATSSAGAAGLSADAAEHSRLEAVLASGYAKDAADAAIDSESRVSTYKNAAEAGALSSYNFSLTAQLGATEASGYANSAFNDKELALAYSNDSEQYALSSKLASGYAETAAGRAENYFLQTAEVSGSIETAATAVELSAHNASGYAENSRLSSVSASGYAQEAHDSALLVASYLGASEVSGYIGVEAQVRASADSALADQITQLGTTVGSNTTIVQEHTASIDGIKGLHTIQVDNNGVMSGYGLVSELVSGAVTSEFSILADKFSIVKPGHSPETGTRVFAVDAFGNVGIRGALVIGVQDDGSGGMPISEVASVDDIAWKVDLISSGALILRRTSDPTEVLITIIAKVYRGKIEVTNTTPEWRFRWKRFSADPSQDSIWNSNHLNGYKTIPVTSADVYIKATFSCEILEEI